MLIEVARSAAVLAAQIDAINGKMAAITNGLSNGATISGGSLSILDPISQSTTLANINPLTVAESATVFNTMLGVLQARLATLTASLDQIP